MPVLVITMGIVYALGGVVALLLPLHKRRPVGKHRGTPGQLTLQKEQRVERWGEWAEWMTTSDSEKASA